MFSSRQTGEYTGSTGLKLSDTNARCLKILGEDWMKRFLIAGFLLIALLVGGPLTYSTMKGYTQWFWRDTHARVFVNGRQISGYVHRSRRQIIVTRRDLTPPRSYWIELKRPSTVRPRYCGSWSAPDFFVFTVGDVNLPCLGLLGPESNSETPEAPDLTPLVNSGNQIEFRTIDFQTIRVVL